MEAPPSNSRPTYRTALFRLLGKVKQSRYRPRVAQGVPGS